MPEPVASANEQHVDELNDIYKEITRIQWINSGTLEDFIIFDDQLPVHECNGSDPETILSSLISQKTTLFHSDTDSADSDTNDSSDISTVAPIHPVPTYSDAQHHLSELLRYSATRQPELLGSLLSLLNFQTKLEHGFAHSKISNSQQTSITDYFSK